jgi:hypothetical protein
MAPGFAVLSLLAVSPGLANGRVLKNLNIQDSILLFPRVSRNFPWRHSSAPIHSLVDFRSDEFKLEYMLGTIDELRTYFDLAKMRVVRQTHCTTQSYH